MEKVLFFSWHEIEVSIRIAFHAIKNITSDILSEIILQNKSRQTENSVGDFTYPIIYKEYGQVSPTEFSVCLDLFWRMISDSISDVIFFMA